MAKSVQKQVSAFADGLKDQAEKAKQGEIGWIDAAKGFWVETRKFAYRLRSGGTSNERKRAIDLVKSGMKAFNNKSYHEAEELFRRAAGKDPGYGRAHAYLGNALYKQKRLTDAVTAWNKAIEVEPSSDAADLAREKLAKASKPTHDALFDIPVDMVRPRG